MQYYTEPECRLPIVAEADVVVAGGGVAGYAAALASARNGAKTILIEQGNCIGGMATAGMMSHFTGASDSPCFDEVMGRARSQDFCAFQPGQQATVLQINHEALKCAMLDLLREVGVEVRLYTFAAQAVNADGAVRGVVVQSKSGRQVIMGKYVIDATGDGDIAADAGAAFQLGREGDGKCQPCTLMFRIGGVDYSQAILPGSFEHTIEVPGGEIQALGRRNLPAPAGHVLLYPAWLPGEVCVNMTNAIDINGTKAEDLTRAEFICRSQIGPIISFLRQYAPGYGNCYLVTAASFIGVRETRHFKGLYTITEEDIVEAPVFPDWIATRNWFNFDIHNIDGAGLDRHGAQAKFHANGKFTVPLRACIPEAVGGLLLAGRNISGTHKAHSCYRAMPICLNIGTGVGTAAALAAKAGIAARDLDIPALHAALNAQGVTV